MALEALVGGTWAAVLELGGTAAGTVLGLPEVRQWAGECRTRLVAGRAEPRNHDLVRGIRTAHLCAVDRVVRRHAQALRDLPDREIGADERSFADAVRAFLDPRLKRLTDAGIDHEALSLDDVADVLARIADPATAELPGAAPDARAADARAQATARALDELEQAAGRPAPPILRRLFDGDGSEAGWHGAFALYVTEQIKTNERFRSIFLAASLADTRGAVAAADARNGELLARFPDLGGFMGEVRGSLGRIEGKVDLALDELAVLKRMVAGLKPAEAAAARVAGVSEEVIIGLARRIRADVDDPDTALRELERAVEVAIEVQRQGRTGTNAGDLVDAVLRRIAELSADQRHDEAADAATRAFEAWEQEEAERRAAAREAGLRLLDAGLKQDILRRDAEAAAGRLMQMIELEHPDDRAARFAALRTVQEEWYVRGRDAGLTFDLDVTLNLARLAVRTAHGADERGAALNQLGVALATIGARESSTSRLEEAVATHRAALEERNRDIAPLHWALTQMNLGSALTELGAREAGTSSLEQGLAAYRAALEEWTRDRAPFDWAATQMNLGNVLAMLGVREAGTARLEEAVAAYRAALEERTRDRDPMGWAGTQLNLGNALHGLALREAGTPRMLEAVAAYRAVLEEWTRDRVPLDWARTQVSLGNALSALAEWGAGTARLEEAVVAYCAALEEAIQDRVPLDWATAQSNLGNALRSLGEREQGTARLRQAVSAYCAALEERTRDRVPLDWAGTQGNLGRAMVQIAERTGDPVLAREGLAMIEEAHAVFGEGGHEAGAAVFTHWIKTASAVVDRLERAAGA